MLVWKRKGSGVWWWVDGLKYFDKNLRLQFSGASHNSSNKFVGAERVNNEKDRERVKEKY